VAEVRVHRDTGRIEPVRYVCAHDVGLIVNPETCATSSTASLSTAQSRAVRGSPLRRQDGDERRLAELSGAAHRFDPQSIEIHLISRPESAPSGGRDGTRLVPAAIGNAVFDATASGFAAFPSHPNASRERWGKFPPKLSWPANAGHPGGVELFGTRYAKQLRKPLPYDRLGGPHSRP